jgi:hypothetical protein
MDAKATQAGIVSRGRHVSHVNLTPAEFLEHFEREFSC